MKYGERMGIWTDMTSPLCVHFMLFVRRVNKSITYAGTVSESDCTTAIKSQYRTCS